MERRAFLRHVSAAGLCSWLDPAYASARDALGGGAAPDAPVPRRAFGHTTDTLSLVGFGGIVVMNATPAEAARHVGAAFDAGVTYFDVAPTYGNAQERLGPALAPYRARCFLACKTTERAAEGARRELRESLRLLRTDRFDLYQLHAITTVEDVDRVFAPGGAMEALLEAKRAGAVRYLGFSAHSEEAAHAALDRYAFDSVLFPFGFTSWIKGGFGPSVHARARKEGRGVLALKAMAHQKWRAGADAARARWKKAWYEPLDTIDRAALGLRFTAHLPVDALVPPGEWELFWMAVQLARTGALTPLNAREREAVDALAAAAEPLFARHA
jgi:aryl-alcohol dehydrogenase-like predicted oxidoreductase